MKVKDETEKASLKLSIHKTKIMASGPITSWQIDGLTVETVTDFIFLGSKITADGNCSHKIKRRLLLERKARTKVDSILKSRDITLPILLCLVKAMVYPVVMWELDHKESWPPKNWCFWTAVLKKTLESPLDCKKIQPVNPKGNQSWIFIGRTDAEALIFWPPDVKNWLIGKGSDAGKDWRQEEKGTTEDEIVGWHHQLNGHEFEQTLGVGDASGKPGMLQSIGSQRVRHNCVTELSRWADAPYILRWPRPLLQVSSLRHQYPPQPSTDNPWKCQFFAQLLPWKYPLVSTSSYTAHRKKTFILQGVSLHVLLQEALPILMIISRKLIFSPLSSQELVLFSSHDSPQKLPLSSMYWFFSLKAFPQ